MRSGTPLPSGTFVVELRPDARAPFVEIGTRIAASYLLDLALPAGYGPCDLHVLALGAGAACGDATDAWRPGPPPASWGAASKEEAPQSRLSGTGPYQVRFASTPRPCPPPWHLLVRSDDGLWAGAAPVESIEGACASLPAPRIEPRAIVRGRLRAGGELDLRGARVAYEPRAPRPGEPQFSAAIERDGEFRLAWLPPGPGRLSIRADSVRAEPIELDLRPLQELALEVPARALALAEVRGRLRVLQGELDRIPELHLQAVDPAGLPARRGRVFLEGPQRARFEFDPVPPGEYELRVLPSDSQLWQPERQRLVAPATELEILRLESELASVVLDVLAAEDLARLAEPRAYLIDGGELRAERGARGLLLLERVSPLAGPTLFVLARDRRPVEVGLGSLARNGRFLHGRIELRRGFGALVRVLDASSGEPLEGASVLGDGRELGLSDARGLFLLACEVRPARVEARLQGEAASLALEGTAPVDLLELVELRIAR